MTAAPETEQPVEDLPLYWKDGSNSIMLGHILAASGAKSHPTVQEKNDNRIAVPVVSTLLPGMVSPP